MRRPGAYLTVPAAGVRVAITRFPLGERTWDIDPFEALAGHFEYTPWLAEGNTVIGGHARYPTGAPGVFFALDAVPLGAEIVVTIDGKPSVYTVIESYTVDYRDISPLTHHLPRTLTLITCDLPTYKAQANFYPQRRVVVGTYSTR